MKEIFKFIGCLVAAILVFLVFGGSMTIIFTGTLILFEVNVSIAIVIGVILGILGGFAVVNDLVANNM